MVAREVSSPSAAEERLRDLCITLLAPPEPFGTYVEAVRMGNLLFLTGMLPTQGREARFTGRVGAELDVESGAQGGSSRDAQCARCRPAAFGIAR
jgi:hypothetical protein